jgi:hypothetical protein
LLRIIPLLFLLLLPLPHTALAEDDITGLDMYYGKEDLVVSPSRTPKRISRTAENVVIITRRWTAVIERKSLVVSRMIPGNWGKVEPGGLARPLLNRIARFGSGGRIHQFLWSRSHAVSYAKRNLAARSDKKPL